MLRRTKLEHLPALPNHPHHSMKTPLILAILCAVGLLAGYGGRRLLAGNSPDVASSTSTSTPPEPASSSSVTAPASPGKSSPHENPTLPGISITRSVDTVASILALDPTMNYARIALWTTTASEADLTAYWAGYKGGKRSVDVTDLIFLNWTRRNPQAAVAAVAGTEDDRYAWWSWASNDPQAALAASLSAGKGQQEQVACGIGDFNPDWLRAHLGQIPEEFRDDAFNRLKNWPDSQNPLESLKFMKENGMSFDQETFKSLVRKDPWAALDWLKENPGGSHISRENETMASLVSILSQERPEDLERIASQTPPGEAKRQMEQALFDRLLETDPDAALDKAREAEAPLIAAQRMAKVALGMVATDPEKAFDIAGEILKANPDKINIDQMVVYPDGGRGWSPSGSATDLMDTLYAKDRERTLQLMAANTGDEKTPDTLFRYTQKWAAADLEGLTTWANQQTGKLHQAAAQNISFKLAEQGSYTEAIEWAGNGYLGPDRAYGMVLYYWNRTDPTAASAWLDNASLTDEQKGKYREQLQKMSR